MTGLNMPANRIPWLDAGFRGDIPNIPNKVSVLDYGATPNDSTDDTAALKSAISAVSKPGAVYIPAGTYYLSGKISVPSNTVIRGAGPKLTKFLVTPQSGSHTFNVSGSQGPQVFLTNSSPAGSNKVYLQDTQSFSVGKNILLQMENADVPIHPDRPASRRQIAKVVSISGNEITLDTPLRLDYPSSINRWAYPLTTTTNAGFEDFYVKHISSDGDASNIFSFSSAENSWVKNVESEYSAKYHVNLYQSRHITIRDSYFHHSYNYGNGGQGYGTFVGFGSSDNLIINNIFYSLRHSMLVERAGGNVFAYNYSAKTCCIEQDMSLHGGYVYHTLSEGNVIEWVGIADFWGMAGPYNTIFRNRTTRPHPTSGSYYAGIEIEEAPTDNQNILLNTSAARISVTTPGTGHWIEKNLILAGGLQGYTAGQTLIDNLTSISAAPWSAAPSLYWQSSPPDFWGNLPWPSIGADVDSRRLAANLPLLPIPAQIRYQALQPNALKNTLTSYGSQNSMSDTSLDQKTNSLDFILTSL